MLQSTDQVVSSANVVVPESRFDPCRRVAVSARISAIKEVPNASPPRVLARNECLRRSESTTCPAKD